MISLRYSTISFFALTALAAACSSAPMDTSATDARSAAEATSPAGATTGGATLSREEWRKVMSKTPPPREGCFQVAHPSNTWVEVPCTKAPEVPFRPASGNGGGQLVGNTSGDFSSAVTSNSISWAEGSFPSVTGLTAESDGSANNFSLQLNSNRFSGSPPCATAAVPSACQGWEQFIYAPGSVFMQYWMLSYNTACPSGWNKFVPPNTVTIDCWKNSTAAAAIPTQPITNLANMTLVATAAATDSVTVSTGNGVLYSATQGAGLGLAGSWTAAEFNIFGNANGTNAALSNSATIVVQTLTDTQTPVASATTCQPGSTTAETNSLNLVPSSCCSVTGNNPGIQFTETGLSGAVPQSCAWIGSIYPTTGPSSGGTAVTVTGAGFSTAPGGTQFTFGGYAATSVTCSSSTSCTVVSPAFNPTTLSALVDIQATVGGNRVSTENAQDKFSFVGSGPVCTQSYWSCDGATTMAAFTCNQAPTNAGFQLYREVGGVFEAVTTNVSGCGVLGCGSAPTTVSELGFVPPASQTSTTYKVCFVTAGQSVCAAPITLNGAPGTCSACEPTSCAFIGACGTASDGCGNTLNCGTCPSGDVCSSNQCCPAGKVWNKTQNRCATSATGGCTTPACQCAAAGGDWDGKTCE